MSAQNVTLTSGGDICSGLDESVVNAITTVDNTEYNLQMTAGVVSYNVNDDLYVNSFIASGKSTITLNFGTEGSITAGYYMNFGQGSTTKWSVSLADNALSGLGHGELYERTLLTVDGNYYGIWNVGSDEYNTKFTNASFSDIFGLGGYTNVGIINNDSVGNLQAGEYALVFKEGGHQDSLRLVVVAVPEPAVAAMSLLALAGMAVRRRR